MNFDVRQEDFGSKSAKFDSLMQFRVQHILLVSSAYDLFVLEEDGQVTDLIYNEYLELNLTIIPHVRRAATAEDAMQIINDHDIDLVIIFKRVGDIDVASFGRAAKQLRPGLPIVLLAYQELELQLLHAKGITDHPAPAVDMVFVWSGDARILLSIIKLVEDRFNVDHDTNTIGVRVIIVIEDSVKFFSTFLPLLYTEILQQTRALMTEGLNISDKLLRMRARPKILLAKNYDEAWQMFSSYKEYLLAVISDFRFEMHGRVADNAGPQLIARMRRDVPDLPILMQSSDRGNAQLARESNCGFLFKRSPKLHTELRAFIVANFGFGDFVFARPDGTIAATATDYRSMERCLAEVDDESILYHAHRNHFSNWLMARTEFDLASRLRPKKVSEFKDVTNLRAYLIKTFRDFRHKRQLGIVTDFSSHQFDLQTDFVRIGSGSLGGKGRGLAFVNAMLYHHNLYDKFDGMQINVPITAIIGTDAFDRFLDDSGLLETALLETEDKIIADKFVAATLPGDIRIDLDAFLDVATFPLAVRSSSMLEDSHMQAFAGVYDTHMLPNSHPNMGTRRRQLETAIKLVYASTFFRKARAYHESVGNRVEEEKMAVIVQQAVGRRNGDLFYPSISGLASSYNYYSIDDVRRDDGVAHVALGLGRTIVEGGNCLFFSPAYPDKLPQFSTVKDMLKNSQREFYAIDLSHPGVMPEPGGEKGLRKLDLERAETDGMLQPLCSTYSPENDRIYIGCSQKGIRITTFAPILQNRLIPLPDIISYLLNMVSRGLNCPVEMEFAVDLSQTQSEPTKFVVLQIRPMSREAQFETVSVEDVDPNKAVIKSNNALGNMNECCISDLLVVSPDTFDRANTFEIARQIGQINDSLKESGRPYVLIGPGRWGTGERWLGIPVTWNQISGARVIVEAAYDDFAPDPSFGTHFFHNLISMRIGYFTVNQAQGNGSINWDWLLNQEVVTETSYLKHLLMSEPLEIRIDGRTGQGVILRR